MNIEQPPSTMESSLSAYLVRMFNLIDTVLGNIGKLPVRRILAPKPVVGKLYYYAHKILDEDGLIVIPGEGLYIYKHNDGLPDYEFIA